jgi:protein SCO1/2
LLVVLLVAVAAIPISALWLALGPKKAPAPDFTLTDQNGYSLTLSTLRGHRVALFFGWSHCPDECPTALAHLARKVYAPGAPGALSRLSLWVRWAKIAGMVGRIVLDFSQP